MSKMDLGRVDHIEKNVEIKDAYITSNSNSVGKDNPDEGLQLLRSPDLLMALEIVDKDAQQVAGSLTSLLSSLRLALSQVTSSSVEHMECYNDVAGQLQESALDAASKGNHFINACLRLNEEMKGTGNLAAQLKLLRQTVDHLDSLVTRYLPRM